MKRHVRRRGRQSPPWPLPPCEGEARRAYRNAWRVASAQPHESEGGGEKIFPELLCYLGGNITIQYNTIQYDTKRYDTMNYKTVQYKTKQYNTIQYDTIQYNTLQYDTIQYTTIRYDTIRYNTGSAPWEWM